jgi:STE24 endopeptidase
MDGSKRSTHSNAFFTGIGKVKRIVLFDTLLERLNGREIEAVLAHEIGHERKKHTVKMYLVSVVFLAAGLYLARLLLDWDPLYRAFGFTGASPYALVVLFSICAGPFTFLFKPLLTAWSRKFEYEADEFAVRGLGPDTGGEHPLISGLVRLHTSNLSNCTPHPLYSFYHYSHPALPERAAAIEKTATR